MQVETAAAPAYPLVRELSLPQRPAIEKQLPRKSLVRGVKASLGRHGYNRVIHRVSQVETRQRTGTVHWQGKGLNAFLKLMKSS